MDRNQLSIILEKHRKWLNDDPDGKRADLREADLYGADLRGADLRHADLREADLYDADLREADLRHADLYEANLREADLLVANLRHANLYEANLREADLRHADLLVANLYDADLREADLREADLRHADLRHADLREADLYGADLYGADLYGADLQGAKNIPEYMQALTMMCPEEGSFIGWKKCGNYIIKLLIPEGAKRSSATTRKCRCSKARVLDIQTLDGESAGIEEYLHEAYDHTTVYKIGEITYPDSFDEDRWNECSQGIHFFITKNEAVEY